MHCIAYCVLRSLSFVLSLTRKKAASFLPSPHVPNVTNVHNNLNDNGPFGLESYYSFGVLNLRVALGLSVPTNPSPKYFILAAVSLYRTSTLETSSHARHSTALSLLS